MTDLMLAKAGTDKKQELKHLWLLCFDEDSRAADVFFNTMYDSCSVYVAEYGQKAVAALYLVPCKINGNKAHYLCGAGTLMEYRNKGIMAKLIEYALEDAKQKGDVYSVLFPASDSLYTFYGKFGYTAKCTCSVVKTDRAELEKYAAKAEQKNFDIDFEVLQNACYKNNFLLWNNSFLDFAIDYYDIYDVKTIKNGDCIAAFEEENNTANVIYSVYLHFENLAELLLKSTSAEKFIFTFKSDNTLFENSVKEKYGMIKQLNNTQKIPDDTFIGLTLN